MSWACLMRVSKSLRYNRLTYSTMGACYALAGTDTVSSAFESSAVHANPFQTVSTLSSFVLAILLHSEVQATAQKELDRVVGRGRLPELKDQESLPYITAIMKEVFR